MRDGLPAFEWCHIPGDEAGSTFTFGQGEKARQLAIPYDYWLSKYPVTYAQFEAFVNAGESGYRNDAFWTEAGLQWRGEKSHPEAFWNDPRWHISNHPVVGVTWYEAQAFCAWLTAQAAFAALIPPGMKTGGMICRLTTEVEWEKATRYPDGRRYPWGPDYISSYSNTNDPRISHHYLRRTSPVGIYPQGANPGHGAHDLAGNVFEWQISSLIDSAGFVVLSTRRHLFLGSSWNSFLPQEYNLDARDAARLSADPSYFGFRVAWSFNIPHATDI